MKMCAKCQIEYQDDMIFCPRCGTKLQTKEQEYLCPTCGRLLGRDIPQYCPYCGQQLATNANVKQPFKTIDLKDRNSDNFDSSSGSSFLETVFLLILVFFMVFIVIPKFFDLMHDYSVLLWIFLAIPIIFAVWYIYQSMVSVYHGVNKKDYLSTIVPLIFLGWVAYVIARNLFG